MAATVTQTSNYIEGGDKTYRFSVAGDTAYPTGGYDIYAILHSAMPILSIKRIIGVRHKTVASAQLGTAVAVDTYTTNVGARGTITALKLAIVQNGAEVANGTNVSALAVELTFEGY